MNALPHLKSGYQPDDASLLPQRGVEYAALARVTRGLSAAWGNRKRDFAGLVAATTDNLALWRAFGMDVAEPGNALPSVLRAQLFYLFEFVDHHSAKVLEDGAGIDVLVDINMAVMRGLRGDGSVR